MNRIVSATHTNTNYNLNAIAYDKNGNILNLSRNGHTNTNATSFGLMDDLSYTYDAGNKLQSVTDASLIEQGFKDGNTIGNDYSYDANGNLTVDKNKGITSITYNHLNLPIEVQFDDSDTKKIQYVYDAAGMKLQKIVNDNSNITTTDYAGNYIYENDALQFFNHAEGYVKKDGSTFNYVYQYKDHLGNVRLSYADTNNDGQVSQNEIIEEKHFYPFGLKHKGYNNVVSSNGNSVAQKRGFGGVELQDELGLGWIDISARNYNPAIGRWMNIDPAADVLESSSQYVYALNSPIVYVDKDGELPILINGRTSSDDERGSSKYWNAEIIATIKGSGIANPGGQIHYVDGNRGAVQGYIKDRRTGRFAWKDGKVSPKHASSARDRYVGGRVAASNDFQDILNKLEKDPETGKITEKIQIYTHSRGGSFGAGYTARLLKLIKKNSHLFADPNNVIEYILHMAPHQSNSIKGNKGVKTIGISHKSDILSGNDIEGAGNVHSDVGNASSSHQNSSFVTELNAFLSAVSSNGGANQDAIDAFTKKLKKLGIDFSYKEK